MLLKKVVISLIFLRISKKMKADKHKMRRMGEKIGPRIPCPYMFYHLKWLVNLCVPKVQCIKCG